MSLDHDIELACECPVCGEYLPDHQDGCPHGDDSFEEEEEELQCSPSNPA